MTNRPATLARVAAATALLISIGGAARARALEISPTLIQLSPEEKSAVLRVRNEGAGEVRFQVQVMRWSETPQGEMQLAPAPDVIVFPRLLALRPGEARILRVGAGVAFGPVEKSYRIFLEELPPAEKPGGPAQVRVLSRIGIPVFLAGNDAAPRLSIEDLQLSAGRVEFTLRNRGTAHDRPAELRLSLLDAAGKELFQKSINPWYLLAGGERHYEESVPEAVCARVRELKVEAGGPRGKQTASRAVPDGTCAR